MPQLNPQMAEKVEAAKDGFEPLEPGIYVVQLKEDVEVKQGAKGLYWKWTFEVSEFGPARDGEEPEPQDGAGRRLWNNTSLSEAAFFKITETFAAFGVPTDTDTEKLVGFKVRAQIAQVIIQQGTRKGQMSNEIQKLLPLDGPVGLGLMDTGDGEAVPAAASAPAAPAVVEPLF